MMTSPSPIHLARLHEADIRTAMTRARIEHGCLSQVMVGRIVRLTGGNHRRYRVTKVSLADGGMALLHGTTFPRGKNVHVIGGLAAVEIITEAAALREIEDAKANAKKPWVA